MRSRLGIGCFSRLDGRQHLVDLVTDAIGDIVPQAQRAQELADIASGAGVITVLGESCFEFDQ
ncbi:MAG: hypothetical protein F6Q13_19625 [Mycobacterium sp.]|nr:MAG: hypothetical protein F6Q13_19625 [Mycobacterium sp.]